jgi:hypothetical protein
MGLVAFSPAAGAASLHVVREGCASQPPQPAQQLHCPTSAEGEVGGVNVPVFSSVLKIRRFAERAPFRRLLRDERVLLSDALQCVASQS